MINIRKLESELWESADLLRQGSKLSSQEYCMPVLGLIFLRYAYSRFKYVEAEILKDRPVRNGRVLPVESSDFKQKSAIFLPEKARYDYLLNLPDDADCGKAVNEAMELIEAESTQLKGILPKTYTSFRNDLLKELLRIFNNSALNEINDDILGRIYEYFLNKFASAIASDDGVFFTPKSLVKMIVNIIEPTHGIVLDPACGSGGMFVSSSDFVNAEGINANSVMTFYGQEKVEFNAKLCIMNMAVHGLNAKIKSGDEANSFYHDAHNLEGRCDYVMANPPFNVDKVKAESTQNAGRLPFGLPGVNQKKEVSNANYLWISYFYAYLNDSGRAGFVMAASATDSGNKDREIRKQLIQTGHVDCLMSVANNFFYKVSLPCSLWFFDKGKKEELKDKVLFIDSRNYYTVVDRTLNEWSEWQMKNLNAIVWLYRGEKGKYAKLLQDYWTQIINDCKELDTEFESVSVLLKGYGEKLKPLRVQILDIIKNAKDINQLLPLNDLLKKYTTELNASLKALCEYGDGLEKDEAKEFAKTIDETATTWDRFKKSVSSRIEEVVSQIKACRTVIKEAKWLTEKFRDGTYTDVLGLCKVATIDEIEEKNWSLTPGAYVGVAPVEEDDENFEERMTEIHKELLTLQSEANQLMDTISANFEELGI
ncbi:type I restriction-modification system subunit M [Acetivibrio mesophilus]|uniref:site-specific DNA-methyltransferase (adenine-specific) n=1 Tax=Acetivibrio mesophilus TaxID=2487273 RepID=A0A4Q0I1Z9_9FIRM|nr:type I restriction-modification system subunit M [Acetivibrio mesophilus]RXE57707.1 SAM-dependent DNA methyltransferase [Acetivibrio mesophilus]